MDQGDGARYGMPEVQMYLHSHRGDGCPTPSTLAIRLVLQISLGSCSATFSFTHVVGKWRTNEN